MFLREILFMYQCWLKCLLCIDSIQCLFSKMFTKSDALKTNLNLAPKNVFNNKILKKTNIKINIHRIRE